MSCEAGRAVCAAGAEMAEAFRILVVEDEASVRDALTMILEDEGFKVVSTPCGAEGVRALRADAFDLVITDLRLPDLSGLDVLSAVRFACGRGRAILISAHATEEVCAEARSRGAFGVLRKPFPPSEILRLVADALAAA
ncbi:MAG TPA: response regulator [Pyrinomonadaceae bacterium]|nr:response regulator [Pyrinomonadaceae bacterium]